MNRTVIIILAAAALAGCESTGGGGVGPQTSGPAYMPNSGAGSEAFRAEDFAWSQGSGGGEVDGVLSFRTGYSCAGGTVVLTPETPWSRARMRVLYNSENGSAMTVADVQARTPPEHAQEYQQYARRTTCDANNAFSFTGLPNGAWYVITVANPTGGGDKMAVMRRVVTNGSVAKVVLR